LYISIIIAKALPEAIRHHSTSSIIKHFFTYRHLFRLMALR
jgi:hypothetical protein